MDPAGVYPRAAQSADPGAGEAPGMESRQFPDSLLRRGGEITAATSIQNCTRWVRAPSMIRLVPVIKPARGLARKTTAFATSSGVPIRPVGLRASIDLNISGF